MGLTKLKEEQRPGDRRLAKWRVFWLIVHSTSHQLLWCIDPQSFGDSEIRHCAKRQKVEQTLYISSTQSIHYTCFRDLINRDLCH